MAPFNELTFLPSRSLTQGQPVYLFQEPMDSVLTGRSSSLPTRPYSGFSSFSLPPHKIQWSFPVRSSLSKGPLWPFIPSQSHPPVPPTAPPQRIKWSEYPVRVPPQSPVISTPCSPRYHSFTSFGIHSNRHSLHHPFGNFFILGLMWSSPQSSYGTRPC